VQPSTNRHEVRLNIDAKIPGAVIDRFACADLTESTMKNAVVMTVGRDTKMPAKSNRWRGRMPIVVGLPFRSTSSNLKRSPSDFRAVSAIQQRSEVSVVSKLSPS
jgi:hypothetical protein